MVPFKKILFILSCFILFSSAAVFAQQPGYNVTSFEEGSGIQNSVITAMMQDSKGFMWFATTTGLYRYDGYSFKVFRKQKGESNSLPGNVVYRLAEDHDGKIWIGQAKQVVSCYDPANGIFKNYQLKPEDTSSAPSSNVTMLFVDSSNNVWVGLSQRGLFKLDKNTGSCRNIDFLSSGFTVYPKELRQSYNNIYVMCQANQNIYWLATHDGLYQYDAKKNKVSAIRSLSSPVKGIRDDLFNSMLPDKDGLWLGSWAGGLSFYNYRSATWENYKFSTRKGNVATTNIINDLQPKNDSEIWIASNDKGLGYFNKKTHTFKFLNEGEPGNQIPSRMCFRFIRDRQNNLWVSHEKGLLKIRENDNRFRFVPVPVSRTDNAEYYGISCMLEDKEGRWLFTGTSFADGLHVKDKNSGITKTIAFQVKKNEENFLEVEAILQDKKSNIWVLTRDFLYSFNKNKVGLEKVAQPPGFTDPQVSNLFTTMTEDNEGNIWLATGRNGAFCFNPVSQSYQHFFNDTTGNNRIPSNLIKGIAADKKGRVWLGGTRGCFGYLDKKQNKFVNLDLAAQQLNSYTDDRIFSLYADKDGNIYAGTDAGLYFYDGQGDNPRLIRSFDSESGLTADAILRIAEDAKANIWCSSNTAVCKISREGGTVTSFGKGDGIANVASEKSFHLFADGSMGILTYSGYYLVNPDAIETNTVESPLVITSLKIDDKENYFGDLIAQGKSVVVPAGANIISFEYAALDLTRPDKQEYAYMLEGFDKDWVFAGQRRYTSYANLPGGDYIFKVRATNEPGKWNDNVVAIPVHIEEPFYKKWWFIVVIILALLISFYRLYRYKLKKQQQILTLESKTQLLEKEKAMVMYESLKQQLNPHFLFNSLTSLSSLIRFDQKLAVDFLDGLSKIYRYILKSRDNETVPLNEEVKFVQAFIKLQQTRFDKGLIVNMSIDDKYMQGRIAPVTLQNLTENAIKHNIIDADSPLVIDIYTDNEYIVVKNNLQRKNFVETSNKQGMNNMKSLYHYLTDKPLIVSDDGKYFIVKIPLV